MLPVVLVGDSHLANISGARLLDLEKAAGCRVVNGAVGGANVHDLAGQVARFRPFGILVVSVGTNDAAPWKRVPLPDFRVKAVETLGLLRSCRVIYVAALGVDDARLPEPDDRFDAELQRYASAGMEVFGSSGGTVIDLAVELSSIRADAFEPDGVHLTTAAYDVVVRVLGEAIARIQGSAGDAEAPSPSSGEDGRRG